MSLYGLQNIYSMDIDRSITQQNNVPLVLQETFNEQEQAAILNAASQDPFLVLIDDLKEDAKQKKFTAPALLLESSKEEQARLLPRAFALALDSTAKPFYHPAHATYPAEKIKLGLLLIKDLKALYDHYVSTHGTNENSAQAFVDYLKHAKRLNRVVLVCGITTVDSYNMPAPIKYYFANLDKEYQTTIAVPWCLTT